MKKTYVILSVLLLLLPGRFVFAQTEIVTIDGVYVERDTLDATKKIKTRSFRLNEEPIIDNDVIAFDIPGFGEYLEEANIPVANVLLMIEGIALPEIPAYIENMESGMVRFQFSDEDLTSDHRQLLYNKTGAETKRLRLGIAAGEELVLNFSPKGQFYFEDIKTWKWVGLIMIVIFVGFFAAAIFAFPTLLKDSVPAQFRAAFETFSIKELVDRIISAIPAELRESEKSLQYQKALTQFSRVNNLAFSFSKSQLVFWSLIIIGSFIYIWALTDDFNPINSTALILLGISSATTAAGTIINERQESEATSLQQTQTIITPESTTIATVEKEKPAQTVLAFLQSRMTNQSFLRDILSDNQGISIQRLQSFVFNAIYGVVFIKSVIFDYTMPTFGDVELLLLGISNGTYAFNKTSENK